jgi:hypothetical protein
MSKELTTQRFVMQCEAHGAQSLRQYIEYGESAAREGYVHPRYGASHLVGCQNTAQRSNAHKEWVEETAYVG